MSSELLHAKVRLTDLSEGTLSLETDAQIVAYYDALAQVNGRDLPPYTMVNCETHATRIGGGRQRQAESCEHLPGWISRSQTGYQSSIRPVSSPSSPPTHIYFPKFHSFLSHLLLPRCHRLREAAAQGDIPAEAQAAMLLYAGVGGPPSDRARAVRTWRKVHTNHTLSHFG